MASRMIGAEIGSSTLKLVVYEKNELKKLAVKRMPEDLVREGRVISPDAMTGFLKEMRKEFGIPSGPCSLVLPQQLVIAHHVLMPVMNDAELRLNLPYEFREFVGADSGKYDYDYSVLSVKEGTMELYGAAVRKDVVEQFYEIFRKAGLRLKVAIPGEMAWMNLVDRAVDAPQKLCVVDVGQDFTQVSIFSGRNFAMGKDIEMGGLLLDQAIAQARSVDVHVARNHKEADFEGVLSLDACVEVYQTLAIEIMKAVNFYSYSDTDRSERLEDIYICGGSAAIEPLRDAICRATGMTLHPIRELLGTEAEEDARSCALAAGAAVQKR